MSVIRNAAVAVFERVMVVVAARGPRIERVANATHFSRDVAWVVR
jgi:hypothetical protein